MPVISASVFGSEWVFALVAAVLLLGFGEAGFRAGLRVHRCGDDARRSLIGGIENAVLGLLALLLGFTFAMALDRFDRRRELVVKEANAIGTTWLRAAMLPEPHVVPVKELLRRYVDTRVGFHSGMDDPAVFAQAIRTGAEIQNELWCHAEEAAKEAPTHITGLFIESLNETIDTSAERIAAARARIPGGVTVLLLTVAAFGCFASNYGAGALGRRFVLNAVMLPLVIALTMAVILDFDQSRRGFIQLSIQPLIELQASLRQ